MSDNGTLDLKAIREEAEHAAIRSDPAGRLSAHVSALVDEVERLRAENEKLLSVLFPSRDGSP